MSVKHPEKPTRKLRSRLWHLNFFTVWIKQAETTKDKGEKQ
jgi:hypothetical protein